MKELTLKEAIEVIKEWGTDSDNYCSINARIIFPVYGGDPRDDSVEKYNYHQACLKIIVEAKLKTKFDKFIKEWQERGYSYDTLFDWIVDKIINQKYL